MCTAESGIYHNAMSVGLVGGNVIQRRLFKNLSVSENKVNVGNPNPVQGHRCALVLTWCSDLEASNGGESRRFSTLLHGMDGVSQAPGSE